jgi:hypothetical protein
MAATYAEVRHFSANPSLSLHPVRRRSNVDARHERPLAAFATTLPHACSCPSLSERREVSSPESCHPLLAFGGSLATPGPIAGHRPFLAATRARSSRRGPIPPQAAKSTNRQRAQQCRGGACQIGRPTICFPIRAHGTQIWCIAVAITPTTFPSVLANRLHPTLFPALSPRCSVRMITFPRGRPRHPLEGLETAGPSCHNRHCCSPGAHRWLQTN